MYRRNLEAKWRGLLTPEEAADIKRWEAELDALAAKASDLRVCIQATRSAVGSRKNWAKAKAEGRDWNGERNARRRKQKEAQRAQS